MKKYGIKGTGMQGNYIKKGFVKLYRDYDDRKWSSDPVTFSLFVHFIWMARFDDGIYNGKMVPRGSFVISISGLAKKIGATPKATRGALDRLTKDKVLVTRGASDGTMITICNYDYYCNPTESDGQATGERWASDGINTGQAMGQQYKNKERERDNIITPPLPPSSGGQQDLFGQLFDDRPEDDVAKKERKKFVPPTLDEVKSYCMERGNKVSSEYFMDYYGSKGWMVGRTKMKDWKAAVRLWEQKGKQNQTQTQYGNKDNSRIHVTREADWNDGAAIHTDF